MPKRVSTRKIKKDRLYTYEEAGDALGLTSHTLRTWRPLGLKVMTSGTPHYILGAELIAHIERKKGQRSVKLGMDQMYCFCARDRKSLFGRWSTISLSMTLEGGSLACVRRVTGYCKGSRVSANWASLARFTTSQ